MKKRDKDIKIRVTPEEKLQIQKRAKSENLNVSKYGRNMLLNGTVFVLEKEELFQLKKIGININQLARHANFKKEIKTDQVMQEFRNIKTLLNQILENKIIR